MKKFLVTFIVAAFAVSAMTAQTNTNTVQNKEEKVVCKNGKTIDKQCDKAKALKHECKDHKDGKPCTKPADQQCDDCKAKAAEGMKHECKEGMKNCEKAEGMKHECKEDMKKCEKAEGLKHECKDHKDGQPCTKPADQQCDDCKAKAKKD